MRKARIKEILIFKRPHRPGYCPIILVFDDGETYALYAHIDKVVQRVGKIQSRLATLYGNGVKEHIWF